MSVDSLIELLGERNKYIILWYCIVNFLKSCSSCGAILAFLWANAKPRSIRCKLPDGFHTNDSLPYEVVKGNWIPSQCMQFVNFSRATNRTEPCQLGYVYESYMDSSVITDWDLVCDKRYLGAMCDSSFFVLSVIASSGFTALADRFGRRPVFIACLLLMNISGFLCAFAPNAYVYSFIRLLIGPLQQGCYTIGFCYSVELFPMTRRSFPSLMSETFWFVATMILCLTVYFVKSWKIYYYVTTLPYLTGFLLIWFMPESIPWLIAKGRSEEAFKTLRKAASFMENKDEVWEKIEAERGEFCAKPVAEEESEEIYPCYFVCTRKHIQKWTCINAFVWFAIGMSYYGIQVQGASFGNVYLNFFLMSLIELPAVIASSVASKRVGRKLMVISSYLSTGFILLLLYFGIRFGRSLNALNVVLVVVGRFFTSVIFTVIFLHASEMYPTSLRSMGVAVGTSSARLGIAINSYLGLLETLVSWLPTAILVALCATAASITLLVPETRRWPLAQTLENIYTYRVDPKLKDPICFCAASEGHEVVDDGAADDNGHLEMQDAFTPTSDEN